MKQLVIRRLLSSELTPYFYEQRFLKHDQFINILVGCVNHDAVHVNLVHFLVSRNLSRNKLLLNKTRNNILTCYTSLISFQLIHKGVEKINDIPNT